MIVKECNIYLCDGRIAGFANENVVIRNAISILLAVRLAISELIFRLTSCYTHAGSLYKEEIAVSTPTNEN